MAAIAQPWPRLQKRFCRASDARRYASLVSDRAVPDWHRNRIRSCGGTGAANFITAMPAGPALRVPDAAYRFLLRWRLGLPLP